MNKRIIFTSVVFILHLTCFAQSDTLNVFRTPSKNGSNTSSRAGSWGNNAITVSIGHLGRGGTMLTYERYINKTPLTLFAGLGFTKVDFIGQFSFDDEDFYYASTYTERTNAELGRMLDLGAKYMFDEELGGNYIGFCFSNYTNTISQEVKDEYEVPLNSPTLFKLNYNSNEFKLVYGITNDVTETFYSDVCIGAGLRMIDYQELKILEDYVYNNLNQYSYDIALVINKKSYTEFKPWFFFGWKIGVRF
jgi:hypothetical protein